MDARPPLAISNEQKDAEQLKLLAIFHFVFAGFCLLMIVFLFLHYFVFHHFLTNPEMWKGQKNPPPRELFHVVVWLYVFVGCIFGAVLALNTIGGFCLLKRKCRIFSLIVAGINCSQFPFGTALGVPTFIVLMRDSVRALYGHNS